MRKCLLLALAAWLAAGIVWGQRTKKEEEITQTLELPRELPALVTAETRRLAFFNAPLSAKGLLSQQVRDALRVLFRSSGGASIVKLRAFVAGTGDLRRVRDIVSETFTEHRAALPALSLIQVGALPMEGAQVAIEATAVGRKEANPEGLAFISGQAATSPGPLDSTAPLGEKSLADLRVAVKAAGLEASDVLRVTCFVSSLDGLAALRARFDAEYPAAARLYLQAQRAPSRAIVECEAVARLRKAPAASVEMLNPEGLPRSTFYSQVALVSAPRLVLTGTQAAFGFEDAAARLAYQRLQKSLEGSGSSLRAVVFAGGYPLAPSIAEQVRKIRSEFYDMTRPPASTMLPFEGLPSMDASFAVEVVAVKES